MIAYEDVSSSEAERKETDCCACIYYVGLPSEPMDVTSVSTPTLQRYLTGLHRQ
jgi:hypothetical protein